MKVFILKILLSLFHKALHWAGDKVPALLARAHEYIDIHLGTQDYLTSHRHNDNVGDR